ncbi:MAG: hypothetical protein IPO21_10565 [Bacteroidales bacterium]|nr:hypothetical protein [Bacteroidales bacterium]
MALNDTIDTLKVSEIKEPVKTKQVAPQTEIEEEVIDNTESKENSSVKPKKEAVVTSESKPQEIKTENKEQNHATFTDPRDGEVYKIVQIGNQTWMAENLRATLYNDGSSIKNIPGKLQWKTDKQGAYCWYNNDISHKNTYGALYNWYAVNTGKLCPTGWHVPTKNEFVTLLDNSGGRNADAYENLNNPDKWASIFGGWCFSNGAFDHLGKRGHWWTSSIKNPLEVTSVTVGELRQVANIFDYPKNLGFSVRCVKD